MVTVVTAVNSCGGIRCNCFFFFFIGLKLNTHDILSVQNRKCVKFLLRRKRNADTYECNRHVLQIIFYFIVPVLCLFYERILRPDLRPANPSNPYKNETVRYADVFLPTTCLFLYRKQHGFIGVFMGEGGGGRSFTAAATTIKISHL